VPEIERTVGAFINTIPLASHIRGAARLTSWLQAIQADVIQSQQFAQHPLSRLAAWAGLPADQPLFDTLLVCENYPTTQPPPLGDLRIHEVDYALDEGVPLVVEYVVSPQLICRLRYRTDLINAATVQLAALLLRTGIESIPREADATVGHVRAVLAAAAASGPSQDRFAAARREALRRARPAKV
jgi:hypothetical protein